MDIHGITYTYTPTGKQYSLELKLIGVGIRLVIGSGLRLVEIMPRAFGTISSIFQLSCKRFLSCSRPLPIRAPPFSPMDKKVLVIGSGHVSGPVIEYLAQNTMYGVDIGTNVSKEGEMLLEQLKPKVKRRIPLLEVNVLDEDSLSRTISKYDLCISLVPPHFHVNVLKQCLNHKVHLVTPSYSNPEFEQVSAAAKDKGVVVFCEQGLDPGIDHMLAMECIDHAHSQGGEIVSFVSYCGGVPAPENRDNPLGYKFSWSPRGVLMNAINPARYLHDGEVVEVPAGGDLMKCAKPVTACGNQYEGIPNRDSIKYHSVYNISSVETLLRGTLRYQGYADVLRGLQQLGLIDGEDHPRLQEDSADVTWRDILGMLVAKSDVRCGNLEESVLQLLQGKTHVFEAIRELGLLSDTPVVCMKTPVDTLAHHLVPLLAYNPRERDMVVLQHEIDVRYSENKKVRHTITLEAYGHPIDGYSAMALTVGFPVATTTRLILEGKIKGPGLLFPLTQDVYGPILEEIRASSKSWATWTKSSQDID